MLFIDLNVRRARGARMPCAETQGASIAEKSPTPQVGFTPYTPYRLKSEGGSRDDH